MNNDELIEKIAKLESRVENNEINTQKDINILFKRYEDLNKEVTTSTMNIQRVLMLIENLNDDFAEIKTFIEDTKTRPAKNWNSIIMTCATGIVSALTGALMVVLLK